MNAVSDTVHRDAPSDSRSNELLKNVVRRAVPRSVRNWLRSPSRSLQWIWDEVRFSAGITKTLTLAPNVTVTLHPHAFRTAQRNQIADGDQHAEFIAFLRHCNSNMVLFDVGAHFGVFSLVAVQFGASVVAVDPSPDAVRMITANSRLNRNQHNIRPLLAAVSDKNGDLPMLASGVFSEGYFQVATGRLATDLTNVNALTIDAMTIQFGVPTHIKIDVEGHEAAVLRGGRDTLSAHGPVLFLELHNELINHAGNDPRDVLAELHSLRYRTFTNDDQPVDDSFILGHALIRVIAKREEHAAD
jgi:FkbM family methyltransferase